MSTTARPRHPRPPRHRIGSRVVCSTRRSCSSPCRTRCASSTRDAVAQPGDVHRRGRRGVHARVLSIKDPSVFGWSISVWLWLTVVFANLAEAVAEGRGKAQAETLRRTRTQTVARRLVGWSPGDDLGVGALGGGRRRRAAARRPRRRRGRRGDPRRRRRRRRRRQRRRVGDHRRVGAGDPRVRRRPLVGDRRHEGAVGPDRRPDHQQAGRDVHRPDDRAGRGRVAAEDAQRDRAEHPARQPDDHLPARGRDPAAAGDLLRRASSRSPSWSRCWSA